MPVVLRNILTTAILVLVSTWTLAQITLNGKSVICEGDLGTFSFTIPAGKTVKSYDWDFGDTYTSTKANPTHLFKKQGTYTIKLEVTYTTNQVLTYTRDVDVVALPNASFQYISTSDTCHYTNEVCFIDKSTPVVSGRPIQKRTYFWGDGKYDETKSPKNGDKSCHSYYVPDSFYVEMEVEDNLGCKSTVNRTVKIVAGVVAKLTVRTTYPDCESAELCFTNTSTTSTGGSSTFKWIVDDSTSNKDHFSGNSLCINYKASTTVKARLEATANSGCTNSIEYSIPIKLADPNRKIKLDKTKYCYGEKSFVASIDFVDGEKLKWSFNGAQGPTWASWNYNFATHGLKPGKYTIYCEVSRGSCSKTYSETVEIIGPVADIKLFNATQCRSNRKVFFVDRSTYFDSSNVTSKWVVWDSDGDDCIINRSENLNRNKNCNVTIGWFGKHQFSTLKSLNRLDYTITDTVTGCSDFLTKNIDLDACGNCTGGSAGHISLCEDGTFINNGNNANSPEKVSLDSGKTWHAFPLQLNGKYAGDYMVGLIYKFSDSEWVEEIGNDSIRVHKSPRVYIDTLFIPDLLTVYRAKNDKVSLDFESSCNPTVARINFENGKFYPSETIRIDWSDGKNTYIDFKDTIITKSFTHAYAGAGGSGTIKVIVTGNGGCLKKYEFDFTYGHESDFDAVGNPCLNEEMCLFSDVSYYKPEVRWDSINKLGKIEWLLNGVLLDTTYDACYTFDSLGLYRFDMVSKAMSGCTDTVTKTFYVHRVTAGIKDESKGFFCNGQRTFLDSSSINSTPKHKGVIDRYYWDLGSGTYSSYEKNPTVAFDGTKKNVLIRHMAVSHEGCSDETQFNLRVLTSKPHFSPKDSVGCAPFTAELINHTVGANQYIWELGDTNNITIERDSLFNEQYTYHKPGEYYVRLIGIDSFLNTKTGFIETCHTVYPELGKTGIKITVLPSTHRGIFGPDTLCVNDTGSFESLDFISFDKEVWRLGDNSNAISTTNGKIAHAYTKAGTYTITLHPEFAHMQVTPKCIRYIEKNVEVVDVTADFGLDPSYEEPEFGFFNYSSPKQAAYFWDFGQPSSGPTNHSTIFEPSHDYGIDSGEYTVCLVASVFSCFDTFCKKITNTYYVDPATVSSADMYNVFTPGNGDGKNDVFEIQLNNQSQHDLVIYNRWGDVVFESRKDDTKDESLAWNGKINNDGKECPSGTYFYLLKYAFNDNPNEEITLEGTVTLIRD